MITYFCKSFISVEYGKLMDGWETRRKRVQGHDWCIIKLAGPATIEGILADTAYFTGNYAPRISVQAARISDEGNLYFSFGYHKPKLYV